MVPTGLPAASPVSTLPTMLQSVKLLPTYGVGGLHAGHNFLGPCLYPLSTLNLQLTPGVGRTLCTVPASASLTQEEENKHQTAWG